MSMRTIKLEFFRNREWEKEVHNVIFNHKMIEVDKVLNQIPLE